MKQMTAICAMLLTLAVLLLPLLAIWVGAAAEAAEAADAAGEYSGESEDSEDAIDDGGYHKAVLAQAVSDFSVSYVIRWHSATLIGRYNPGVLLEEGEVPVRASTDIKLSEGQFGRAKVILTSLNNEMVMRETPQTVTAAECGGTLNSGKVRIKGQKYAKRIVHYGWRATNSGDIEQYVAVNK